MLYTLMLYYYVYVMLNQSLHCSAGLGRLARRAASMLAAACRGEWQRLDAPCQGAGGAVPRPNLQDMRRLSYMSICQYVSIV